jgi:hypothetical protein
MPRNRRFKSRRRQRQRRVTRKQRGGRLPPLKEGVIQWPPNDGCVGEPIQVTFQKGDIIDRFGPPSGTFVSPTEDAARRIAGGLGITNNQPNTYSYTNRALPYAGVTNSGVSGNTLRKQMYNSTYKQNLERGDTDYHQYVVLLDGVITGKACVAAPVFNTSGGAIQVKLDKTINEFVNNGAIEERPVTKVPGYFRRNDEVTAFGA